MTLKKKHRQNHSQRASGEKNEVKQQGYEDRTRRTSNIWTNDEKNREEQSQRQAREQSQRQAREPCQRQAREVRSQRQAKQTKGLRPRQGEVRGETLQRKAAASQSRSTQEAMQMSSRGNTSERKPGEGITTITKIDFGEETMEYKNLSFTVQKDTEVIHREVKGGTKINCHLKENQSEFSEKCRLKDLVKKHWERKSSRQLRNSDSESPEDSDHTGQSLR